MEDFEVCLQKALQKYFTKKINGSAFHFVKTFFTEVQNLGFQVAQQERDDVNQSLRKVTAHSLFNTERIRTTFDQMMQKAAVHPKLLDLLLYVQETWIIGITWTNAFWFVYNKTTYIKTNTGQMSIEQRCIPINTRYALTVI